MWTAEHRQAYERAGLRYPSDLTDAEWALVEPFIPPARRGGRQRTVDVREVLNGILYVLATGCQWRALPKDLPPRSTVHGYLTLWAWDGTLEAAAPRPVRPGPRAGGQGGEPDGRDHRQPERQERRKRGPRVDPTGFDAGKKVKGKKRHILVDTLGLLSERRDPAGRHPGPRRRAWGLAAVATLVPVHRQSLRGFGLCRRAARERHLHCHRDRQEAVRPGRLCGPSAPMGGRAFLRLDQP